MIQDVGNVELFELCETDPKTQCKECLSYWSEGIVCCTCGHLLKETVASRSFTEYTLDLLSIPNYVIKKGRPHGHRYGKTKEYHQTHNFKKEMHQEEFWRDSRSFVERSRISWISTRTWSNWRSLYPDGQGRAERFHLSNDATEYFRYKQNWWISLNKSGNTGPWRIVLTSTKRCPH